MERVHREIRDASYLVDFFSSFIIPYMHASTYIARLSIQVS